jgi:PKD repeat protein
MATIVTVSTSLTTGQRVEFTVNTSGGTGALTDSWIFGDGSNGTGSPVNHTYSAPGTYRVSVWVNDSSGGSVESSLEVTVSSSNTAVAPASSPIPWGLLAGLLVLIAVVALAAVLLMRRRGKENSTMEESSTTAPEDRSTDAPLEEPVELSNPPDEDGDGPT